MSNKERKEKKQDKKPQIIKAAEILDRSMRFEECVLGGNITYDHSVKNPQDCGR